MITSRSVVVMLTIIMFGCGGSSGGGHGGGCFPACAGRNCGDDGCGGTCGACQQGYACGGNGSCVQGCTPSCGGKVCGPDGCGASCGSCSKGFKCGGAGSCDVDPSGLWALTITTGNVSEKDPSGSAWDFPGGLPDPFVCLTINGTRTCTSTAKDTLMPIWNETVTGTAIALESGVIVEMWDEDVSVNDPICAKGTVPVTEANLKAGVWGAKCNYGNFSAVLAAK